MRTDTEQNELKQSAMVIVSLSISAFLTKIKTRAEQWKKDLSHGN